MPSLRALGGNKGKVNEPTISDQKIVPLQSKMPSEIRSGISDGILFFPSFGKDSD
ncbi:hypothetical protein [Neisseria bergeri]|uniref:hypothetical protein n=1 Tax=Neisseria bergeri TaxID=1906581 RepID=UPI0027DF3AA7|nr:hypothetical protein [Neisseria bergeri]